MYFPLKTASFYKKYVYLLLKNNYILNVIFILLDKSFGQRRWVCVFPTKYTNKQKKRNYLHVKKKTIMCRFNELSYI